MANNEITLAEEIFMALKGLKDKVAVITGGAQGLGAGIARRLLEEGAKVCVVDINGDQVDKFVEEVNSPNLIGVQADVSKEEDAEKYMAAALKAFGAPVREQRRPAGAVPARG